MGTVEQTTIGLDRAQYDPIELTGAISEGAMRFNFLSDASQAEVDGPGLHAVGWAEEGYTMNEAEINMGNITAAVCSDGQR